MAEQLFQRRIKQQRHRFARHQQHTIAGGLSDQGVKLDVEGDDGAAFGLGFLHSGDIGFQSFDDRRVDQRRRHLDRPDLQPQRNLPQLAKGHALHQQGARTARRQVFMMGQNGVQAPSRFSPDKAALFQGAHPFANRVPRDAELFSQFRFRRQGEPMGIRPLRIFSSNAR